MSVKSFWKTLNRKTRRSRRGKLIVADALEQRTLLSTFYVNSDTGSNDNDGRNRTPFASIQHGLDAAAKNPGNDTVVVEVSENGYQESLKINDESGTVRLLARNDTFVTISAGETHGLQIEDSSRVVLRNLQFSDSTATGILSNSTGQIVLRNVAATNNADGITIHGSANAVLRDVVVSNNSNDGIKISSSEIARIFGAETSNNKRTGLTLTDVQRSNVREIQSTKNGQRGILVQGGNRGHLLNGHLENNGHDGFKATELTERFIVRGTTSNNNASDGFDVSHIPVVSIVDSFASGNIHDGLEADEITNRIAVMRGEYSKNGSEGISVDIAGRAAIRDITTNSNGDNGIELSNVEVASLMRFQSHANTGESSGLHATNVGRLVARDGDIFGHTNSGIRVTDSGQLTFIGVSVFGNSSSTTGGGLSITDSGRVAIRDSKIIGNKSADGGGLFVRDLEGRFILRNSSVMENSASSENAYGGGIWTNAFSVIAFSEVNNNVATGSKASGGGIYTTHETGDLRVNFSTIAGNKAAGRLNSSGSFSYAFGGGTYVGLGAKARFVNSTISGNSATMDMTTGPEDTSYRARGGGIYKNSSAGSTILITQSTIAFNQAEQGGGLFSYNEGTTIRSSIIVDNKGHEWANVNDEVVSRGYNISDGTLDHRTDLIDEAFLLELAYNGGETQTHAFNADSIAIDAARGGNKKDQRGMLRDVPDIGAFEFVKIDGEI